MRKTSKGLLIFALAASLPSFQCGVSPKTQFIALTPIEAGGGPPGKPGTQVAVGKVELPPELDRSSLVRHSGDNQLDVVSTIRWPAPLDVLVRRTLALDLATRLPKGQLLLPGQPQPDSSIRLIVVTFKTFAVGPGDEVRLEAYWTLIESKTEKALLSRVARSSVQAASTSGDDIAHAMSVALGELADQMATEIRTAEKA